MPWSIESVLRKDLAEWRKFNEQRRAYGLGWLTRQLVYAGENPMRFLSSVFALSLAIWTLLAEIPEDWLVGSWVDWGASEQLGYFSTVWSVQATLAGLLYPIVIAFVTLFLQRRPLAEAFVHLYMLDSCALVAGLASVGLVLAMALQYALLPIYGAAWLPTWAAIDAVWFSVNCGLTLYFLYKTIEFLRPEVQKEVISRYSTTIALERDIIRLYSFQILAQAPAKGWLPAPNALFDGLPEGPKVILRRMPFREGETQSYTNARGSVRSSNVYFFPLRLLIAGWMRAAESWPSPDTTEERRRKQEWPVLAFPIIPGATYEEPSSIATVHSGPSLKPWQNFLLRRSFAFKSTRKKQLSLSVRSILDELEVDAKLAAERADVMAFDKAYNDLTSLHQLLVSASITPQRNGEITSWALLPDIDKFMERPLHENWSGSYRSVMQGAIETMEQNARPARLLCHLTRHISCKGILRSPLAVRENIIELPPMYMYHLSQWWARRADSQSAPERGFHYGIQLSPPSKRTYEDIIAEFSGGWENVRRDYCEQPDNKKFDWNEATQISQLSQLHLEETARMLLHAVARGDIAAAEWLADCLNKWWSFRDNDEKHQYPIRNKDYITIEDLTLPWQDVVIRFGLKDETIYRLHDDGAVALQRSALSAALENYWTDIRLLVIQVLLFWENGMPRADYTKSLALDIASGLLSGKQWKAGGSTDHSMRRITALNFLQSMTRQFAASGHWWSGYEKRLSKFVERVKDIDPPRMVSSRIYSRNAADDLASLLESQVALFVLFSDSAWNIDVALQRQIDSWINRQHGSVDIMKDRAKAWLGRLDSTDAISPGLMEALLPKINFTHTPQAGRQSASAALKSLQDILEKHDADAIIAAEISPKRLECIAQAASSKAFFKTSGNFPLPLFDVVGSTTEALKEFTLNNNGMRKGELTEAEFEQRAINEDEFWSDVMETHVAAVVMSDVINDSERVEIMVNGADEYWDALKSEAAKITSDGMHPVLLVDNATRPDWLWNWQHENYSGDHHRPNDMEVRRTNGNGTAYIFTINNIDVYTAPIPFGKSILLPREKFSSVQFQDFGGNIFVDVKAFIQSDSPTLVDLHLRFGRRVNSASGLVVALNYVLTT